MEGSATEKYLEHHGILGMKWGVRRYQNKDGTLTKAGRKRYLNDDGSYNDKAKKEIPMTALSTKELQDRTARLQAQNNYLEAKKRYEANTAKEPSRAAKLVSEFMQTSMSQMSNAVANKLANAVVGNDKKNQKGGEDEAFLSSIDFSKKFDASSLNGLSSKEMKRAQEYVKNANNITKSMNEMYSKYEKQAQQAKKDQEAQKAQKKKDKAAKKEEKKKKKEEKKKQRQNDADDEDY